MLVLIPLGDPVLASIEIPVPMVEIRFWVNEQPQIPKLIVLGTISIPFELKDVSPALPFRRLLAITAEGYDHV